MEKDSAFYNAESERYSRKRYPKRAVDYVQAFYLRRLAIVIALVRPLVRAGRLSVLEIGCADGIVLRRLLASMPGSFSSLAGVDSAPRMIDAARELSAGLPIDFSVRECTLVPRDLVLEVGVLNYVPNLKEELAALSGAIAPGGHAIISVAGTGSLWQRLKREGGGFAHFRPYGDYEATIRAQFSILACQPVGLFIPHLWKVPAIARLVQPACETIFAPFLPEFFHERIYLLRPL
jgi:SAM-dependent methyltransferase